MKGGRGCARDGKVGSERFDSRVRRAREAAILTTFTRQLATVGEAGMPLVRGLRILEEQERTPVMKDVIGDLQIGRGRKFVYRSVKARAESFSPLYVNMVRAGGNRRAAG